MLFILKPEQNVLQLFSMPRQASAGSVSLPINFFWSFICANRMDINPMFVPKHVVALFVLKEEHADCCVENLNTLSSTSSVSCSFSSSYPLSISNDHKQQPLKDAGKKPKYD